jgi:YD repeat-containing protein
MLSFPSGRYLHHSYVQGRLQGIETDRDSFAFGYDPSTGQLLSAGVTSGVTATYAHDGPLLSSVTWSDDNGQFGTVEHSYDDSWRLSETTINGDLSYRVETDPDGRPRNVVTSVSSMELDYSPTTGLLNDTYTQMPHTDGAFVTLHAYNAYGEISGFASGFPGSADPSVLSSGYAYTIKDPSGADAGARDARGRILYRTETYGSLGSHAFGYAYDDAGRLREVQRDGALLRSFTYDANGNRRSVTTSAGTAIATYNDNDQLVSYDGKHYEFDEDGYLSRMVVDASGASTEYDYDVQGNLRGVTLPSGVQITYEIDAQNRRVGKRYAGSQGYQYR